MANKTGKNKQCPYRTHCSNECYGDNPCDFAAKFDKMQKKINRLSKANSDLVQENTALKERLDTLLHPKF